MVKKSNIQTVMDVEHMESCIGRLFVDKQNRAQLDDLRTDVLKACASFAGAVRNSGPKSDYLAIITNQSYGLNIHFGPLWSRKFATLVR